MSAWTGSVGVLSRGYCGCCVAVFSGATHAILGKAYDADELLGLIDNLGMIAVIPPKANRKIQRDYDCHLY